MKAEEIAQWVIDNRYPKSEQEKVCDFEMYHFVLSEITLLLDKEVEPDKPLDSIKLCWNCKHFDVSEHIEPCKSCLLNVEYKIRFKAY